MTNDSEQFNLLDPMLRIKYLFFLLNNFVYFESSEQRHLLVKTKEENERPSLGKEKEPNQGKLHTSLRTKDKGNDYQNVKKDVEYVGDNNDDDYYYSDLRETTTTTTTTTDIFYDGVRFFFSKKK